MTNTETVNATSMPINSAINSEEEKLKPNLISFIALNPNITGTARKNVNSAAATLETPISKAPIMVDPEREVPGIIESTWNKPITKAVSYPMS